MTSSCNHLTFFEYIFFTEENVKENKISENKISVVEQDFEADFGVRIFGSRLSKPDVKSNLNVQASRA
jgi:hypothetical protein